MAPIYTKGQRMKKVKTWGIGVWRAILGKKDTPPTQGKTIKWSDVRKTGKALIGKNDIIV